MTKPTRPRKLGRWIAATLFAVVAIVAVVGMYIDEPQTAPPENQ